MANDPDGYDAPERPPGPCRTLAVSAATLRDVRTIPPGGELLIRNDAPVPIDVEYGTLTSVRLGLVDSGDLDGARAMARGILEGEGVE